LELVSIIIPCFNYGHLLSATLKSVRAQTYENWEAIIIDDGSTDNTRGVAEEFGSSDARIKYFYCVNSGLSAARNRGIKESRGEYVLFLDADDLIAPCKLEGHINHFFSDASIDISYSEARYFESETSAKYYMRSSLRNRSWMPQLEAKGYPVLKELIKGNIMPVSSSCIKRSVIEKVGIFSKDLPCMEDWDYWLRCAFAGGHFSFLKGESFMTLIRVQRNSMSKNFLKMADYELLIRGLLDKRLISCVELSKTQLEELRKFNSLFSSRALIRTGRTEGISNLFKADLGISFFEKLLVGFEDVIRYLKIRIKQNAI
jgi:glycosyltransferase involved in cell wall biosynthesis